MTILIFNQRTKKQKTDIMFFQPQQITKLMLRVLINDVVSKTLRQTVSDRFFSFLQVNSWLFYFERVSNNKKYQNKNQGILFPINTECLFGIEVEYLSVVKEFDEYRVWEIRDYSHILKTVQENNKHKSLIVDLISFDTMNLLLIGYKNKSVWGVVKQERSLSQIMKKMAGVVKKNGILGFITERKFKQSKSGDSLEDLVLFLNYMYNNQVANGQRNKKKCSNALKFQQKKLRLESSASCSLNYAFEGFYQEKAKQTEDYLNPVREYQKNGQATGYFLGQATEIEWNCTNIKKLFEVYNNLGPKWRAIAQEFQIKSQNAVKNKFHLCLKKFLRKLNNFIKEKVYKHKKLIKYESIIHVLNTSDQLYDLPKAVKDWNDEIRIRLFSMVESIALDEEVGDDSFEWLMTNINKYNITTKSFRRKLKPIEPEKNMLKNLESLENISQVGEQQIELAQLVSSRNGSENREFFNPSQNLGLTSSNSEPIYDFKLLVFNQGPALQNTNDFSFDFDLNKSQNCHQEFDRFQSLLYENLSSLNVGDLLN